MTRYEYDPLIGMWTKCAKLYADMFFNNWEETRQPQAFLLYDKQPFLPQTGPVFIHSAGKLHSWARFIRSEEVRGFKTFSEPIRVKERERIWKTWRSNQLHVVDNDAFNRFWDNQEGIRSLFVMRDIKRIKKPVKWGEYGLKIMKMRGYPRGVGYRYLTKSEVIQLFKLLEMEIPPIPNLLVDEI